MGGFHSFGGGIYNSGSLTISNSGISGNIGEIGGGGIYNIGQLSITNHTEITHNTAGLSCCSGGWRWRGD